MLKEKAFEAKYFLGWYPASLPLSAMVSIPDPELGIGFVFLYGFGLCFFGLCCLGVEFLLAKSDQQDDMVLLDSDQQVDMVPFRKEIIWWIYPPLSILFVVWILFLFVRSMMKK
jgi:hypothetical protein